MSKIYQDQIQALTQKLLDYKRRIVTLEKNGVTPKEKNGIGQDEVEQLK